jgi:hypothetical protein
MRYMKVFGIQRSGTTFMRELCRANFVDLTVYTNEFGWKHTSPRKYKSFKKWVHRYKNSSKKFKLFNNVLNSVLNGNRFESIIIIKNPYSWYHSIKKWYGDQFNFEKSYKKYNNLYLAYKQFHLDKSNYGNLYNESYIIRYEYLLRNTTKAMNKLSKFFGIDIKNKNIVIPAKIPQSDPFNESRRTFYLSGDVFGLKKRQVEAINKLVDWDLMKFYGYQRREIR